MPGRSTGGRRWGGVAMVALLAAAWLGVAAVHTRRFWRARDRGVLLVLKYDQAALQLYAAEPLAWRHVEVRVTSIWGEIFTSAADELRFRPVTATDPNRIAWDQIRWTDAWYACIPLEALAVEGPGALAAPRHAGAGLNLATDGLARIRVIYDGGGLDRPFNPPIRITPRG